MRKITLKAARVNAGLTQDEACNRLHISKSTLVAWEKNKASPKPIYFTAACRLYGFEPDEIFFPGDLSTT